MKNIKNWIKFNEAFNNYDEPPVIEQPIVPINRNNFTPEEVDILDNYGCDELPFPNKAVFKEYDCDYYITKGGVYGGFELKRSDNGDMKIKGNAYDEKTANDHVVYDNFKSLRRDTLKGILNQLRNVLSNR